jgi:hypothetical protein
LRYHRGVSIGEALKSLGAALSGAGVPLWQAPDTLEGLSELEAELAPMRLPEEVREFWQQVDVRTLRASPYPGFSTPDFALTSWRTARAEFSAFQPLAVVQVGYESHACMSAELDLDGIEGGALFEWFVSDASGGFERRFNSMADWVSHVAALIDDRRFLRRERADGPWLLVPHPDDYENDRAAHTPPAHPRYGDTLRIGGDILDWPEHWRRANGVRPENLVLRGATHTVAELLASPPETELRATVAARVVDLAGLGGASTRVRVEDATGRMDVACPGNTSLLGPRMRVWYEFDVIVTPGSRTLPADPEAAGEGLADAVERLTAKLMARYGGPPAATAEAIRRMPAPQSTSD